MEFLGALVIIGLAVGGLAIGVLTGRKTLRGSCGRAAGACDCAPSKNCAARTRPR